MPTLHPYQHWLTQLHDRAIRCQAARSSSRVTHRRTTAAASAGTAEDGPTRLAPTALHMGQHANRVASSTTLPRYAGARGRKRQGQSSSFRHHVQSVNSISPRERPRVNVTIATCTSPHSCILGKFLASPDTGVDVTVMGRVQFNLLGITSEPARGSSWTGSLCC